MQEEDRKMLFDNVYEEHADIVFRHIYFRISDRERAKELSQDVFMRFWEYVSNGKDVENTKSFLLKSAHNAVVNEYRSRKDDVSLDEMMEKVGDKLEDTNFPKLESRLLAMDVLDCISLLPANYKDVIIYKYIDDMTIKEIAELLGESESNVSVRIHRASKKLANIIKDKEQQEK